MARWELELRHVAAGTGISRTTLSPLVRGRGNPKQETTDRILRFCRRYESHLRYDDLFGRGGAA